MSTRDCTPNRFDRVDPREGRDRAEMPGIDRVSLLREGACINRFLSAAAERFLPNVTIDQRSGGNFIRSDGESRRYDGNLDPRNAPGQFDPRYGAEPRNLDPRSGDAPRYAEQRPSAFHQRYGADPRAVDRRYGGEPGNGDPRYGADYRSQNGRNDDPKNCPADVQMHDHVVHKGDSLWKIARHALRESGQPAGARDIMSAIKTIVEANKAEHPSLASNPNLIMDGWHLKVPIGGQGMPNRDGSQDLFQYSGDQRRGTSQDLFQYGGDQRRDGTRYDGGYGYDQRNGGDNRRPNDGSDPYNCPNPYDQNQYYQNQYDQNQYQRDPYQNPYRRNPYDGNPYDRNRSPYDRSPYDRERSPYDRNPDDGNPYHRPPGYNQDYNQDAANAPTNPLSMALKDAALLAARGMQTIGRCAAGVQVALSKIGHSEFMGSGNAWDMGRNMANSGKFDRLPLSEAREGDVIVRSWNRSVINQHGGKNWGDIVVVTSKDSRGNLIGANDHHGRIPPDGGRYCNSYVLRCRA